MTEPETIEITDPSSRAFYAGVSVGIGLAEQIEASPELSAASHEHQLAWFWLYVGTAAAEHATQDTMNMYVTGAGTRQPQRHKQFMLTLTVPECNDEDIEAGITAELAHRLRLVRQSLLDNGAFNMKPVPVHCLEFTGGDYKKIGEWEIHD